MGHAGPLNERWLLRLTVLLDDQGFFADQPLPDPSA